MKKLIILLFITLLLTSCQRNQVIHTHGIAYLENREKLIIVNKSNKNDAVLLLGQPATKGMDNNNLWIYIERTTSSSKITKMGDKKLLTNNVLILEMNNRGLLGNKIFLNKDKMRDVNFSKDITTVSYQNRTFVYDFLSTLRRKINDPLKKRD